jgi:hypothetical protein
MKTNYIPYSLINAIQTFVDTGTQSPYMLISTKDGSFTTTEVIIFGGNGIDGHFTQYSI